MTESPVEPGDSGYPVGLGKLGTEGERLGAIHIGDRFANLNREVELDHSPALPLPQGVEEFQNRCIPVPFFGIFLFLPVLRGIHGSSEFKNGQAFTCLMDGVAVRAEVQKCGDSGLELLVRERSKLVLS
jgi:hypothetical protein